jgi:alpha-glucosidase
VHDVLAGFRSVADTYDDRLLVGETYLPVPDLMAYYGGPRPEVHLPMNFQLMLRPWTAESVAALVQEYEDVLPPAAWPNWVLGNHDNSRLASRLGLEQARVAAMLLLTLRGTPFLYYGDEIAMEDGDIPADKVVDVWELNMPGQGLGRDPSRTPMQWNGGKHGGFTTGDPWLPVSPSTSDVNVKSEAVDPLSTITLYRRLLALRRAEPALAVGTWRSLGVQGGTFIYLREAAHRRLMIALNMSDEPHALLLQPPLGAGRILISTHLDRDMEDIGDELDLRSDEGVIVELSEP